VITQLVTSQRGAYYLIYLTSDISAINNWPTWGLMVIKLKYLLTT